MSKKSIITVIFLAIASIVITVLIANHQLYPYDLLRSTTTAHFWNGEKTREAQQSDNIKIKSVRIINEDTTSAIIEVQYTYNPQNNKSQIFAGAAITKDNQMAGIHSHSPGSILAGSNTTQISLKLASSEKSSMLQADSILIKIYESGGSPFHEEFFNYKRTWCKKSANFLDFKFPCNKYMYIVNNVRKYF